MSTVINCKGGADMTAKTKPRELAVSGLMTSIICILSPISMPLPGMVPISLATLSLYLCTYLLGGKRTVICYTVYLALGCIGIPVFSGFTGGLSRLVGPTGGYLIGYFAIIVSEGAMVKHFPSNKTLHIVGMVFGTVVCYLFGTAWLCLIQNISFVSGLFAGVLPFIPGDAAKIAAVCAIAPIMRSRLEKAGLLR